MSQVLISLSMWFHAIGTVILIGHYSLLSVIYVPVLEQNGGAFLSQISKRSRPWMYASLLIFMVTGIYLMLADPNYLGIGDFGNPWAFLMLTKHVLIVAMIGMGFVFNGLLRVGPMISSNNSVQLSIGRFRLYSNLMAISGLLVLLLTAFAQAQ